MSRSTALASLPAGVIPVPGQSPSGLALALADCRQITRTRARNFHYGIQLMPEPKRSAMVVLYAFMRACDDLADQAVQASGDEAAHQSAVAATRQQIERFRATMQKFFDVGDAPQADEAGSAVWTAFHWMIHQYPLDARHLHDMLDGQVGDLTQTTYPTFDDLYRYCYQVASTVGLACLAIWEGGQAVSREVQLQAEYRGIALQLTNILRDVKEDAQRGRVYLPESDLVQAGWDAQTFRRQVIDGTIDRRRFAAMMQRQIQRAGEYYDCSARLEESLAMESRPTCWAMMRIYQRLWMKIAREPAAVLDRRVKLNLGQKLMIAWQALRM